jgi:hypothetical protein
MKKLPIKKIPGAFAEWSEKIEDIWIGRLIRSMGYTKTEIAELAKTHPDIDRAVKIAVDSLFEKMFYKVIEGYFTADIGDFYLIYHGQKLNLLKKKEIPKYNFNLLGINDFSEFNQTISPDNTNNDDKENPDAFISVIKK